MIVEENKIIMEENKMVRDSNWIKMGDDIIWSFR